MAPAWHGRSAQFLTFLSLAKPKITDTRSTCAKLLEDAVIPQVKRRSKLKRREAALVLGAAGVSLAMAGGASATTPTKNVPSQDDARRIVLGEEEISDVSLATFHVFDKENDPPLRQGLRLAAGHGGCGGCGHGGGCGGCGHGGGCAARVGCAGGCAAHVGCAGGCAAHVGCAGGCRGHGCKGGCRGGCACGGVWIGVACLGCGVDYGTCWQWDPALGQWINVCY